MKPQTATSAKEHSLMSRLGLVALLCLGVHGVSVMGTLWALNHPGPGNLFVHEPVWTLALPVLIIATATVAALVLLVIAERAGSRTRPRLDAGETTTDRLTRLPNRNAILTILDNEWQNCRLNQLPLTVVLIEIDRWESINQNYGYTGGDRVLVAAKHRLRKALRRADHLGRIDDATFLLVLPGVDEQAARRIAERCQESLQIKPVQPGHKRITITASLGLCCGAAHVQETPDAMLDKARSALQSARETGGDRAIVYGAPISPGLAVTEMFSS